MSRVPPLPADDPALREVALELGAVPAVLASLGKAPESLAAVWGLLRATLIQGKLPRTTKELIALAATASARIGPLTDLLRASLSQRGIDEAILDDLVAKGETPRLPERTQRILMVGRRAVLQPAVLTDAELNAIRRDGLEDAELAELIAFAGAMALLIAASRALACT